MSLSATSTVSGQQRRVIDPIRNALGFWSRLLNRMAQPRLPSDDELRFTIDDFDLDKLEKLLRHGTEGHIGGQLVDKQKVQQLLAPLNGVTPKPATSAAPPNSTTIKESSVNAVKHKKTPNVPEGIPEADEFNSTNAEMLLQLARKELDEIKLEEEKSNNQTELSKTTTSVTLSTTTVPNTVTNATLNMPQSTVPQNAQNGSTENHPVSALNSNDISEDKKTVLAASSDGNNVADEETEENLYFEKELRARMKHFEEVENALLSELGSGEEPESTSKKDGILEADPLPEITAKLSLDSKPSMENGKTANENVQLEKKSDSENQQGKKSGENEGIERKSFEIKKSDETGEESGNKIAENENNAKSTIINVGSQIKTPPAQEFPDGEEEDPVVEEGNIFGLLMLPVFYSSVKYCSFNRQIV